MSSPNPNIRPLSLLSLPPELLLLITSHLPYPDALSFKHTTPYLYTLVRTSVRLRVSWLVDRGTRGLVVPRRKCVLKTDAAFCCSGEVRRIMDIRRRHGECRRDGGSECEVVVGRRCEGARRSGLGNGMCRGWMGRALLADEWLFVVLSTSVLGLAMVLLWMRHFMLGEDWPLAQVLIRRLSV